MVNTNGKTEDGIPYAAPAMTNSIVLDPVGPESMKRYEIVKIITLIIRVENLLITLQIMIGISNRSVIINNSNALAARLIRGPE